MTAIILAGGKAIRMKGKDKAFLKIGRQTLINRQLKLLKKIFKKIIIVTDSPQKYINFRKITIVRDIVPYQGPLGGIYSGLLASSDKYNFVLACDMPFIDTGLIRYMCAKAKSFDVTLPRIKHKYEPLFAIYSKNCLKVIKSLLDRGIFKISKIFAYVKAKKIPEKEILRFGLPKKIFTNINTLLDLKDVA